MDHFVLLATAVGLCLDCFASALSCGSRVERGWKFPLKIAIIFATVQTSLAVLGWLTGNLLSRPLSAVDHWVAFLLLLIVGARMIHESFEAKKEGRACKAPTLAELVILGFATSIDAFIVGGSFALIGISILLPAIYIAAMTVIFSISGALLGSKVSEKFGSYAEIGGGLILILMGFRILLTHLFL